jgi:hypothetical protein
LESFINFDHKTHTGNLGDLLCSPRYYFEFEPGKANRVIGGGVQTKLILGKHDAPPRSILWGVGCTGNIKENEIADCKDFLAWGIRDRLLVENEKNFLPCVSVLHPMLDLPMPKKEKTLLYINADPRISSIRSLNKIRTIASKNHVDMLTNRASEKKFRKCLSQSTHIISTSYHGAYWGLLSGRSVTLIGYSFKFKSLLNIFGLESEFIRFSKGNQESFLKAIRHALSKGTKLALYDSESVKSKFREKQHLYARHLEKDGIFKKCKYKLDEGCTLVMNKQPYELLTMSKYYARVGVVEQLRSFKNVFKNN